MAPRGGEMTTLVDLAKRKTPNKRRALTRAAAEGKRFFRKPSREAAYARDMLTVHASASRDPLMNAGSRELRRWAQVRVNGPAMRS